VGTRDAVFAHNEHITYQEKSDKEIKAILDLFSPPLIRLRNDTSCNGIPGLSSHPCCKSASGIALNGFLQYYYLRDTYRDLKRYEQAHNVSYDWYVRLRPDVTCFEPFFSPRMLSRRRVYVQSKERVKQHQGERDINDYLFVVPRQLADDFFERQLMSVFEAGDGCDAKFPPEEYLFTGSSSLPFQVLPFPCVRVMSSRSAQCFRLHKQGMEDAETPDQRRVAIPSIFDIDGSKYARGERFEQACERLASEGYFDQVDHRADKLP
jgi:hypothetical protein